MMIPAGYLAKRVVVRPDWITGKRVEDIYSLSGCTSENFADYINFWKHNGYWLFDSPHAIAAVAKEAGIDLSDTTLFYYEVYESEFNQELSHWESFAPEGSIVTSVSISPATTLEGYDVVNFFCRSSPECSPLSCNDLASSQVVNRHCLFETFEEAFAAVERGVFKDGEPGPLRIFSVYSVQRAWPSD